MTNTILLKSKMLEKGFTIERLASIIGLSSTGLFNKIHNIREFRVSEMLNVSKLLSLTIEERDRIFFANWVEFNSTLLINEIFINERWNYEKLHSIFRPWEQGPRNIKKRGPAD